MAEDTQDKAAQDYDGPVLELKDVSIVFERDPVLNGVSLTVNSGETRVLLGPAGGGKSVLMKLVNGLIKPDSGSIKVFGQEITTMSERELFQMRRRVGMVFQESALFDSMNVEDNVAYRLNEEGVSIDESHKRVEEALQFVELSQAIAKFPSELSGGMRRRVSIARAIITKPDLILYDSPTGGLDPITSTTIVELVMKQRDVSHTTSLMITHRLQDAFLLATSRWDTESNTAKPIPDGGVDENTKFVILNEGKVVFDGTTLELTHSDDPWIKSYLE
ncbi:ABC-type transport system involved in resistance to organic solvents, ATPase component [Terriglobus roseus DSM 18391]|uniref:ABC-type transport system involved in resistance to organic solvents, ATPase component n=1 Tax=Terriglobus roseus (strain DSM 18391 / NRRL B-41598 / KBS 63) TaxID=926566 RepID=I3ZFY8_TERRK|nr:ATP-binding cassette domain-containing protein [Terriglobus roseus]AFL88156.1 ABC-type transport system involved in resistance to organic solvents, ATPase component [Terriglobus roseus DSM 18391]